MMSVNTNISMKIDPKGRIPPSITITLGSINHFFSGIGLGTALILQGMLGCPAILRPNTVPTRVRGRITNRQIAITAICHTHRREKGVTVVWYWYTIPNHCSKRNGTRCMVVDSDEVDRESSATDESWQKGGRDKHLSDPQSTSHSGEEPAPKVAINGRSHRVHEYRSAQ